MTTQQAPAAVPRHTLDPRTSLDHVHLTVRNLEREVAFYRDVLGLQVHDRTDGEAALGAGQVLLRLTERPDAPRPAGVAGLYHFCILVPERVDLAQLLRRIVETRTPVQGLVDHRFSEAIYLPDPEGNGIELNWDRPREQWPDPQALLRLGNAPLDVPGLERLVENAPYPWPGLPAGSKIGHIHLHVGDLAAAERFYVGVLGFEKRMEIPGQAVFVSAGGYHHHVAFNLWAGRRLAPPPPDAAGLRYFAIRLADGSELRRVVDRVRAAGIATQETAAGVLVRDPAGIGVVLTAG
jgi:catechol 2,3-dioxygenase